MQLMAKLLWNEFYDFVLLLKHIQFFHNDTRCLSRSTDKSMLQVKKIKNKSEVFKYSDRVE